MKKRALGIILSVLCVLLLFSACGGKDKKEKKNLHPPKCSDNNCESSLYKNCEVSSQGQQS